MTVLPPGVHNSVSGCNDFMEDEDNGGMPQMTITDLMLLMSLTVLCSTCHMIQMTLLLVELMAQTIHKISNL